MTNSRLAIACGIATPLLLLSFCGSAPAAPISGGYTAQEKGDIIYLRLTQVQNNLTGYFQLVTADDSSRTGYRIHRLDLTGSVVGSGLTFTFNNGQWDGRLDGGSLNFVFPTAQGQIGKIVFRPVSVAGWNEAVTAFEYHRTQLRQQQARAVLIQQLLQDWNKASTLLRNTQHLLADEQRELDKADTQLATAKLELEAANQNLTAADAAESLPQLERDQAHDRTQEAQSATDIAAQPIANQTQEKVSNKTLWRFYAAQTNESNADYKQWTAKQAINRSSAVIETTLTRVANDSYQLIKLGVNPPLKALNIPAPNFYKPSVVAIGVVMRDQVQIVRRAGSTTMQVLFTCASGEQVRIVGKLGEWYCVLMADDSLGCILAEKVSIAWRKL